MDDSCTLTVRVVHGDLRHADYPLALGHYQHDVIVNAEAALDAALGGVLRHRFDLGVYPGEIGTSEIVREGVRPPGAIVVGLGPVGELTPERLRLTFATALRRHALAVAEDKTVVDAGKRRSAAFSSVFVGTDGGGLGGQIDSIHAIVRAAVDANRSLREAGLADKVWIDEIEFVELYEDVAIRAAHVLDDLPGPVTQELESTDVVEGDPMVYGRPGGRFLRPADPYASGWWQRIAVRRKAPDGATGAGFSPDTTTALQFTVLTDRARLEQDVSVGQRALIQQLVTSATGRTDFDPELSVALYQLVVPPPVIDRISRGGDLLFMVDRAGAAYPYELMAERSKNGPRPLAENRGVLRQFETSVYRVQPEMARAPKMFIVGNPKTILWPDLPGALKEAKEVEEVAKKSLEVVSAPRDDAERTIVKLMTGEFRVLHFAAHGQFDPDPMKSGVIVGDRTFITPDLVGRLPLVPELVFLNCCYLGTLGEARPAGPDPRLAASLAEGFIQAGVRAVVAAGWAVDDNAGRTFARTFYERFLTGDTFGDAVREARDETRRNHPQVNTWGAYQCYGNPDYRFLRRDSRSAGTSSRTFVARSEALQAFWTLASNARSMRLDEVSRLTQEFEDLHRDASKWASDGEVLTACGEICGELEDFDRAIDFYRSALKSVPAKATFQSAEQLANLLSRSAAKLAADGGKMEDSIRRFGEASSWLDWLDDRLEPSGERLALRGALHKRWAICDRGQRKERIVQAMDAYAKAAKLAKKTYQDLNALALEFVNGSSKEVPRLKADAEARREKLGPRLTKGDRDFWDVIAEPDTFLHWHVIHGTLASGTAFKELLAGYERARQVGPSPRQWASVLDHIWFLNVVMGDDRFPCWNAATAAKLGELLSALGRPWVKGLVKR